MSREIILKMELSYAQHARNFCEMLKCIKQLSNGLIHCVSLLLSRDLKQLGKQVLYDTRHPFDGSLSPVTEIKVPISLAISYRRQRDRNVRGK